MHKIINSKITLNHSHLFSTFEDLVLMNFKKLSDEFSEALLAAELLRYNAFNLISLDKTELNVFDNLANEIDAIFTEHKYEIIRKLKQSVGTFETQDVIFLEIDDNSVRFK